MYYSMYDSSLGKMMIVTDESSLKGLYFEDQKYYLEGADSDLSLNGELEIMKKTKKWLDDYFDGLNPNPSILKLDPSGTDFQREVWNILTMIPYSKTSTYGEIADIIAKRKGIRKMSAQAIGNAISHNHISVIIPCHRVVGKDGSMVGYAGGIDKKKWLLDFERK